MGGWQGTEAEGEKGGLSVLFLERTLIHPVSKQTKHNHSLKPGFPNETKFGGRTTILGIQKPLLGIQKQTLQISFID